MSLRDQIKDELAAAYSLGITEGERRERDRLTPEDLSLLQYTATDTAEPPAAKPMAG